MAQGQVLVQSFAWVSVGLAPFIGSFLGVVIRRWPRGRSIALGRSACESCGARLTAADLVPVLSYLCQRGRCRHCGARIAPAHLAIELAALAVPLAQIAAGITAPAPLWAGCGLGWSLLVLAGIDLRHQLLPDLLTLPLLLAGLAYTGWQTPPALAAHALAACLAWALLAAIAALYRRLRGRDGLGLGDAKLLAAGGAWLGPAALPYVLLLAALATLAGAGLAALAGRPIDGQTRLPFGPALAAAIFIFWLMTVA